MADTKITELPFTTCKAALAYNIDYDCIVLRLMKEGPGDAHYHADIVLPVKEIAPGLAQFWEI